MSETYGHAKKAEAEAQYYIADDDDDIYPEVDHGEKYGSDKLRLEQDDDTVASKNVSPPKEKITKNEDNDDIKFNPRHAFDDSNIAITTTADGRKRMNVIVLYPDDWRHNSIGKENPIIKTPFLDSLADEGIRFRLNAVTTSICWKSRATLFSGQWARNFMKT